MARLPADLVIENVTVITMNQQMPFATGVAVTNGKITALLSHNGWPLKPDGVRINGNGRTLLPGLIDAHCHLRAQISQNLAVSCNRNNVTSIAQIVAAIREKAATMPVGAWIRAVGYDPFYLQERRHPTRWDLDKATQNHPIRLRHVTRHVSVLNSAALRAAGIGADNIDPVGLRVDRDSQTGEPTGIIYGGDSWLSKNIIPPVHMDDWQNGVKLLQQKLLSKGITAVHDATPTNTIVDLKFWAEQIKQHQWSITTQLMADEENHSLMSDRLAKGFSAQLQNHLQMGPVKIVLEALPELHPSQKELIEIVTHAAERGCAAAIHVVDPEMTWAAIEAIQLANRSDSRKQIRHRLEHVSLCPEAFVPEIAKHGIVVVTNPGLIYEHGDRYLTDVDASEHSWLYPMNSLVKADIPLAAGSDAPIAGINPWIGIQTACTRTTQTGNKVAVHEKLTRWHALKMYTVNAALAGDWQNKRGMIQPGYEADLILLEQNPLTCPQDALESVQVKKAWSNGNLVYQA
ncbi:amidohydrolase [Bacillus rubiinfantis]|uniref:amidohydrolase n=1 Tax=Bacillus rubiinfantis TaxID=1499680 RepID=UPI0005A97709|nr:amidohydrolase [Bacillus rubiinfantis]